MNFAANEHQKRTIDHLWTSVEKKLQTPLNTSEGLVKLLLHQQLLLAKQSTQIEQLRSEVTELRYTVNSVQATSNQHTETGSLFLPATSFKEYLQLSSTLKKDKRLHEQAVSQLCQFHQTSEIPGTFQATHNFVNKFGLAN